MKITLEVPDDLFASNRDDVSITIDMIHPYMAASGGHRVYMTVSSPCTMAAERHVGVMTIDKLRYES